jgi:16S rRNA (cytidine1402-2'-O)-methyltransferase
VANRTVNPGTLFLVATPIGNLGDASARAVETLQSVDLIAAEDTRHSKRLMQHFGVDTRLLAYHEHNEEQQAPALLERMLNGQSVALISDAGTPLVSDPGYRLVNAALGNQVRVVPVPGPCAAIAALSASGLPTDRFVFEGFPPAKQGARRNYLQALKSEQRTLVFYVSCHRITETLADMMEVFGGDRQAVLARELTKTFETIRRASLNEMVEWVENDENQRKGEIVVLVEGATPSADDRQQQLGELLRVLVEELPVKQAAAIAARLTGLSRNEIYRQALSLKEKT